MSENTIAGGLQYIPQMDLQKIYLDFDGELTRYNGEFLAVDEVFIQNAALSAERVAGIVAALNEKYFARNVVFVTERPVGEAFSTIYVGKTDAFDSYGKFAGLAETVDIGNKNKSDNAFVLLDSADSDEAIVSVIDHEAAHLLGELDHGGAGLQSYAAGWNIYKGDVAMDKTVTAGETANVYSGGRAVGTVVNTSGTFNVANGGQASGTTINGSGSMAVSKGGSAYDISINPYGYFYVSSGGRAEKATIRKDGALHVYNGGEISDVTVENGGKLELGSANNIRGGNAQDVIVSSGGKLIVSAYGTVENTTIHSAGKLYVYDGGRGTDIVMESGSIWQFYITVDTYVQAEIAGENLSVKDGQISDFTVTSDSLLVLKQKTSAENIVLERGSMTLGGGSASATQVLTGGQMRVESKGVVSSTSVGNYGKLFVSSGGFARDTRIEEGGFLLIYKTGVHRGTLTLEDGAKVTVKNGGVIDFSLENRTTGDDFLISNLSLIDGTPTYTITVSDEMVYGSYKLAAGAADFTGTITIGTSGTRWGELQVNRNGLEYAGTYYTLVQSVGNLYLTVSDFVAAPPFAMADVTADTRGNVTVTADFNAHWTVREFSYDRETWQTYPAAGVVMTENGSVYFRGRNSKGVDSVVTEYQVKNIDRVAPVQPTAQADIVAATNGNVIVTAVFSTDSVVKEFSRDGEIWETYSADGILMSANGSVYFRSQDKAGNISEVTEYQVTNIDKTPPEKPQVSADSKPTAGNVIVTALFAADCAVKEFSYDGKTWQLYPADGVEMSDNGSVFFRGVDAAGNISDVTEYQVTNIDRFATDKPAAYADKTGLTNQNVIVKASFAADAVKPEFSYDGKTWQAYPAAGVEMSGNGSVFFRNSDAAGNVSDVTEYQVTNIDKEPPVQPELSADVTDWTYDSVKVSAVFAADSVKNEYSLNGGSWQICEGAVTLSANGKVAFRSTDAAGNSSAAEYVVSNIAAAIPQNLQGSAQSLAWDKHPLATEFDVEIYKNNNAHVLELTAEGNHIDLLALPQGSYQWHVGIADASQKAEGKVVVAEVEKTEPQAWVSDDDGSLDVFFANASGTWKGIYYAQHQGGSGWAGTNEEVNLGGKNKIADVFKGSAKDPSVLVMTDDTCGDALFLDDVYTALGDAGRVAQISEIRAGAGDDIIDMTSHQFEYNGSEMTVRGGDGNDVIWAAGSDNDLFGDAGNDRIIGSAGFDLIVGGAGDDHMQSGGGDDIFAFGADWGNDTVVISDADSECILWFASGSANNWDSAKRIYKSGSKSVTVLGDGQVSLLFGNDPKGKTGQYGDLVSVGAFADKTSEKIFEKEGKGMLA